MEPREIILDWLRDAYAMEKMAIETLEKQAKMTDSYPEVQQLASRHLEETRWQADQVKACIERLGGSVSTLKTGLGSLAGNIGAMFNAGAPDEVVKNCIGNLAIENFEIASYTSLIAACRAAGETQIADTLNQILEQERKTSRLVEDAIPVVTQQYLQRRMAGVEAKN